MEETQPQTGKRLEPRIVSKTISDMTGFDTATLFTVTGDVEVEFLGVVSTAITCTSGTTGLQLGVSGAAGAFLGESFIDNGTNFEIGDVWGSGGAAAKYGTWSTKAVIGAGADVSLTRSVDDITAGAMVVYCRFTPVSDDGNVVPT